MLLGTFQPNPNRAVIPQYQLDYYRVFSDALNGERPIFCFAANSLAEFCFGAWASTPYWPDRLMLIETEDYVAFDAFVWNQLVKAGRQHDAAPALLDNVDPLYAEYVIDKSALEKGLIAQCSVLAELTHSVDEEDLLASADRSGDLDFMELNYLVAAKDYSHAVTVFDPSNERLRLAFAKEKYTQHIVKNLYLENVAKNVPACEQYALPIDIRLSSFQNAQALRQTIDVNDAKAFKEDYREMVRLFGEQYLESCKLFWETYFKRLHSFDPKYGCLSRNDPCPCNSGKKYKKCCGGSHTIEIKGMQITR